MQQQPDHLHRLSQAHVIGQASSQPQPRDKPQPAHARLLIVPKLGAQSRRIGASERFGRAELAKRFLERGAGGQSDPIPILIGGRCCVLLSGHSGQEPHPVIERQAAFSGVTLDFLPVFERLIQLVAVDFDPLPLERDQAADRLEEPFELGLGQRLAVERHVDGEIEQGVHAQRRPLSAHRS